MPAPDSDEAGLWQAMEKAERELEYSKFLIRDPELNRYVSGVVCRVGQSLCPDVRVYLTRVPYFNATMAPNGMMTIWTGLLLRVTSEAQLAAVVGHEVGHYMQRHALERWRAARATMAALQVLGTGLGAVRIARITPLPRLIAAAFLTAYTRDQEREADGIGLELMTRAGYDPGAAAEVWGAVIEEDEADPNEDEPTLFTATHPDPAERRDALLARARAIPNPPAERGEQRYLRAIGRIRPLLLEDEVRLRQPARSLVVLERLRRLQLDNAELVYAQAEVLRRRAEGDDLGRAEDLLVEATAEPGAPARAWRSLGILRRKRGADEEAARAFRRYLERDPDAPDAPLIRSYLQR